MDVLTRRKFVKVTGISALGGALGIGLPGAARADWGAIPTGVWDSGRQYKILEIFLYGGLSPWETFFVRPGIADPWLGFGDAIKNLDWACSNAPAPEETLPFSADAEGDVALGPFTKPLWRQDHNAKRYILDRMRTIVLKHPLTPHEAAIPYTLTGNLLGRPNFAGLGTAVEHLHNRGLSGRPQPVSYALIPNNLQHATDNFQGVHATGSHGGEFRPLTLIIGANDLVPLLSRPDKTAEADALLRQYRGQYRDQLRWQGAGDPTRSKGFEAYDASATSLLGASSLENLLQAADLNIRQDPECPVQAPQVLSNPHGTAIRAAARLLAGTDGARYVCTIDGGLRTARGGGGYDTHIENHIRHTATNLWNTLSTLADVIQDPTQQADPGKIDLTDTMIILKTEFGRTPARKQDGRDHWPQGYVNLLIGGPIPERAPNDTQSRIAGSILPDGHAADYYTPTDLQGAVMLAAGIYPFENENFGVGDFSSAVREAAGNGYTAEEKTAQQLRRQILGVAS